MMITATYVARNLAAQIWQVYAATLCRRIATTVIHLWQIDPDLLIDFLSQKQIYTSVRSTIQYGRGISNELQLLCKCQSDKRI